jgi:hypothetical protein
MPTRTRDALFFLGFILLAGLAIWGWVRKPDHATPVYAGAYNQPAMPQPVTYDSYGQPVASSMNTADAGRSVNPCVANASYTGLPTYASRDYVRTVRPRTVAQEVPVETQYVERGSADRVIYRDQPRIYHERSKKNSAMIVAGSAGAGAAIGAIAGGGKGAGIGALSGGAAGFIYDRLTHKQR